MLSFPIKRAEERTDPRRILVCGMVGMLRYLGFSTKVLDMGWHDGGGLGRPAAGPNVKAMLDADYMVADQAWSGARGKRILEGIIKTERKRL